MTQNKAGQSCHRQRRASCPSRWVADPWPEEWGDSGWRPRIVQSLSTVFNSEHQERRGRRDAQRRAVIGGATHSSRVKNNTVISHTHRTCYALVYHATLRTSKTESNLVLSTMVPGCHAQAGAPKKTDFKQINALRLDR